MGRLRVRRDHICGWSRVKKSTEEGVKRRRPDRKVTGNLKNGKARGHEGGGKRVMQTSGRWGGRGGRTIEGTVKIVRANLTEYGRWGKGKWQSPKKGGHKNRCQESPLGRRRPRGGRGFPWLKRWEGATYEGPPKMLRGIWKVGGCSQKKGSKATILEDQWGGKKFQGGAQT